MLSIEDNAILTGVGRGAPMGGLLRRFWLPVLLTSELPRPDCPPVRVRLLGEDLVAFRSTSGRIGLVQSACPHRRASLFWGRNEEEGLRCAYHGWKFTTDGSCVDMPSEPETSSFKDKVRIDAYPCVERGGMVWACLGDPSDPPELPGLEWLDLPLDHVYVTKRIERTNWVQAIEGGIDSAHSNFLHSTVESFRLTPEYQERMAQAPNLRARYHALDRSPRFFVQDTDYGMLIGARREAEPDTFYWRVTHWLMPGFNMFGGWTADRATPMGRGLMWCPVDDGTTFVFSVSWRWDAPMTADDIAAADAFSGEVIPGTFEPATNMGNDYLIDREKQATVNFTGLPNIQAEDLAVQESMGPVVERHLEHLGTSDTAIIRVRQRLLSGARDLLEGTEPYPSRHPGVYRVRATDAVLPREQGFDGEAMEQLCRISEGS